ncbi:hypothetical protein B0I72DRAFT_6483 [Yarrowia lipolytica]|nr:hypothetical protein B0I72DRAFT_6483 [Yarrowia lipolytica]
MVKSRATRLLIWSSLLFLNAQMSPRQYHVDVNKQSPEFHGCSRRLLVGIGALEWFLPVYHLNGSLSLSLSLSLSVSLSLSLSGAPGLFVPVFDPPRRVCKWLLVSESGKGCIF